jgi:Alcohol dehydrogenase GroES-like domain
LVKVVATGLCHTDMVARDKVYPVPHPIVLGHEGAGIVESVGADVVKVAPGDSVVLTFPKCGRCKPWRLRRIAHDRLEPGGIQTNWARRAVQNAPTLLPEYEANVGSFLKILRGLEGRAEGDPRKIANVILQLANSDEVPVRLILGVDAEKRVQRAEAARAMEAEKWRHLTVSTVFEDGRFDNRL